MSIDERPQVVDLKSRVGDWEGDTVIGKGRKNAFVTMVERKTLYTVAQRIESKHAEITADALLECMKPYKSSIITITLDNGKEFAQHERIAEELDAKVYFAHPIHRGNEASMKIPTVCLGGISLKERTLWH